MYLIYKYIVDDCMYVYVCTHLMQCCHNPGLIVSYELYNMLILYMHTCTHAYVYIKIVA